jgi:transcriptional regulator with XRE-family HTH domain
MNHSKAIRIARVLADIPQRELADRVSIDPSLISMLESGKRRPSLDTLEKIANALGIPFHLLTLLGTEGKDVKSTDSEAVHQLAIGLTKLLLSGDHNDPGATKASGRNAKYPEPKPTRRDAQRAQTKAG